MELGKNDTRMAKGLAILGLIMHHLYVQKGAEVHGSPMIWINQDVPLIYYLGFLGGFVYLFTAFVLDMRCFCNLIIWS